MSTATQTKPQSSTLSSKGMLIGGQWVESASGARLTVENPAKRAPIAEVPRANAADVERAVAAGTKAYADWRKVAPRERGKALLRIAEAIQARSEELARTIALETGNALRTQARGEANMTADIFRYFGGLGSELKARPSRSASTCCPTPAESRWAWSAPSSRGTRRSCWARSRSRPRSAPATPW